MTRRGANPALAALASLASMLSITTLVLTQTWYARAVWFVVVAVGLGVLVRRFVSRSGWVVLPVQVLGVLLMMRLLLGRIHPPLDFDQRPVLDVRTAGG